MRLIVRIVVAAIKQLRACAREGEPAGQFSNAIDLSCADSVVWDQFTTNSDRNGARDVLRGGLLIDTAASCRASVSFCLTALDHWQAKGAY